MCGRIGLDNGVRMKSRYEVDTGSVHLRTGQDGYEGRIPVLDGVRGIAVLLVLLIHFTPDVEMHGRLQEWVKKVFTTGGWVGVDLFFVLSGLLITGILLNAK